MQIFTSFGHLEEESHPSFKILNFLWHFAWTKRLITNRHFLLQKPPLIQEREHYRAEYNRKLRGWHNQCEHVTVSFLMGNMSRHSLSSSLYNPQEVEGRKAVRSGKIIGSGWLFIFTTIYWERILAIHPCLDGYWSLVLYYYYLYNSQLTKVDLPELQWTTCQPPGHISLWAVFSLENKR